MQVVEPGVKLAAAAVSALVAADAVVNQGSEMYAVMLKLSLFVGSVSAMGKLPDDPAGRRGSSRSIVLWPLLLKAVGTWTPEPSVGGTLTVYDACTLDGSVMERCVM